MKMTPRPNNVWNDGTTRSLGFSARAIFTLGVLLAALATGCTSSSDDTTATASTGDNSEDHHHDHGHRPESYTAALHQIEDACKEIKAAFDAGTPQECDEALHVVSEVLDVLPEVAAETDMPKDDWQIVKDQSQHLFDQFMKIHDGFHGDGKEGVSYDSVAGEIDTALEALQSKIAASGEEPVDDDAHHHHADGEEHEHHEGHDHDDHDHDHHDEHDDHDHDHDEHDH